NRYEGQISARTGRTGATFRVYVEAVFSSGFQPEPSARPARGSPRGTVVARSFGMARRRATGSHPRLWLGQKRTGGITHVFSRLANRLSEIAGNHWTFVIAVLVIVVWALTGSIFGFSDSWQLW